MISDLCAVAEMITICTVPSLNTKCFVRFGLVSVNFGKKKKKASGWIQKDDLWTRVTHTYTDYKLQENISAYAHIAIFGFADPPIVSSWNHEEEWLGLAFLKCCCMVRRFSDSHWTHWRLETPNWVTDKQCTQISCCRMWHLIRVSTVCK